MKNELKYKEFTRIWTTKMATQWQPMDCDLEAAMGMRRENGAGRDRTKPRSNWGCMQ